MTPKQALTFVKTHGVVLESARGAAANLAEVIAGGPIRGSWWGHPKGNDIFLCSRAVRQSPDVLVCRLVGGKVTYIHRRLWPALVRLAEELNPALLAAIHEVHTPSGKHKVNATPFPDWVPEKVMRAAGRLTREQAARQLFNRATRNRMHPCATERRLASRISVGTRAGEEELLAGIATAVRRPHR